MKVSIIKKCVLEFDEAEYDTLLLALNYAVVNAREDDGYELYSKLLDTILQGIKSAEEAPPF